MSLHPGAAAGAMWVLILALPCNFWPQAKSQQETKPIPAPGLLWDKQRQHCSVPGACPTSQLLSEDAVLRVDTKPRELEQAVYGDLPGAKRFNLSL